MKSKLFLSSLLIAFAFMFTLTSCDPDDDDNDDDPVLVEDGIYVFGTGTAITEYSANALMKVARNEALQEDRAQLLEMYIAVKAGAEGFNIAIVEGGTPVLYGPGDDFAVVADDAKIGDEPSGWFSRGTYKMSESPFTVPEDGLYHVVIDTELGVAVVAKADWGLIGGATPGGWGENTPMTATFDLNKMEFVAAEVTMLENDWKFRYSNGWKIVLDETYDLGDGATGIRVNTNLGGALNALIAGGDNISNATYGVYKYTLTWELGKDFVATEEWVRDGEELAEYPAEMYMIGDGVGDWEWANTDLAMIPVHSHPELFWKILWINETGAFKFCEKKEWGLDFGVTGEATDGVYAKGADNIDVPGTAGYYTVVVNLENETIEVNPAVIYGVGDVFGGFDGAVAANKFTVDNANEVIKFDGVTAAGGVRVHVAASTLSCDWWQAEFAIINGAIVFRGTGNDQEGITSATVGQNVSLNFKTLTGTVQ